ncbi:HNH endonuclease signature motif containing protein [Paenibacillus sp. Marseille-Q4541]|uniref:HNH endonuclease n=1 Tax=Paenibacillus sp. Marseille-Q4541 TaxID=2831522 RepID=UPI001BACA1C6|nr:HNH endonuclease signature motif containing protein [Paenibacillus sp. Marseille-Q4541]
MGARCDKHRVAERKKYDEERGSAAQRGYGSKWRASRLEHLGRHPLCVRCLDKGIPIAATVVDHIIPHRGNQKLFWNRKNWQSLCKTCHDTKTVQEDGGFGNGRTNQSGS